MSNFKKQRTGELLQAFIAAELRRVEDPEIAWVTLTGVDMSPDLRNARIYWTIPAEVPASVEGTEVPAASKDEMPGFPNASRTKKVEQALAAQVWHLKKRIAAELGLRYVPQLQFRYDESAVNASRIDFLIRKAASTSTSS